MSMIFVIGPLSQAKIVVFKKIINNLSSQNIFHKSIGVVAELKHEERYLKDEIINSVKQHILENPKKDAYIFTGVGLSLHIDSLVKEFPSAVYYVLKTGEEFDHLQGVSEEFDIDINTLIDVDQQIVSKIDNLGGKFDLEWKPAAPPVILPDNTVKYSIEGGTTRIPFVIATINL